MIDALEPGSVAGLVLLGLAALPLLFTLINLASWPRGRADGRLPGKVSVLIPARDEAARIEACVRAALASAHPIHELIVYDDASTDATPEILARLRAEDARLRVVQGDGLPAGWVGKPHACHRLAAAATGDVLVFLDADVRLDPSGLARVGSLMQGLEAGVVTAVPRQDTGHFFERLVLPLLHLTYTSWFPLVLTWRARDPRFLAANGQILALRRASYDAIGGFESVRDQVVDDMALCRRAKQGGERVVFADGHEMGRCRMYEGAAEVVRGFSKNLYPGIGARLPALVVVLALYLGCFVLPYLALAAALLGIGPVPLGPAALAVGANVLLRLLLALRFRQPLEGVLLQPLAVLAFCGIALNSLRWTLRRQVQWRGRSYDPGAAPAPALGEEAAR
jgi:chlorobactene glucosyltransferase